MLSGVVDHVWVLSLKDAKDRRDRLPGHLAKFGISEFSWHDAFSPEAPEVQKLFDDDQVLRFPPCFRCGKLRCGDEACNNVLIPAQVANFAGYLALWKKIAARPQRALVLEDDVVFHSWAPRVFRRLAKEVDRGSLSLDPAEPKLLRMGWAKSKDHRWYKPFRIKDALRMSNPCHIMTSAYAAAMLERFDGVKTTSDVYLHQDAPRPGEALTVFPPVASELSWSVGSVDSQIHPKEIRLNYLKSKGGTEAEQKDIETRIRRHVSHIFARPLLLVGHPRTGTGFAAELCGQFGLDIGHEDDGNDGISSWMFAVDAEENPWALSPVARTRRALHWDTLIQVVRDPATAVPSIMRENRHAPASYDFRREHILAETGTDIDSFKSDADRAVASLCLWNRIIRDQSPAFVFRIETDHAALAAFLREAGHKITVPDDLDLTPANADKAYKGKRHAKPEMSSDDWNALSNKAQVLLTDYCAAYGYSNPAAL